MQRSNELFYERVDNFCVISLDKKNKIWLAFSVVVGPNKLNICDCNGP